MNQRLIRLVLLVLFPALVLAASLPGCRGINQVEVVPQLPSSSTITQGTSGTSTPGTSTTSTPGSSSVVSTTTVLSGLLREVVRTEGATSQTTTYGYDSKAGPTQGLVTAYTTVGGLPGSLTTTVVSLVRQGSLVTGSTTLIKSGGRNQTITQTLIYDSGYLKPRLTTVTGTDADGTPLSETYSYDSGGRLTRWQRDRIVGGQTRQQQVAQLTWQDGNVSLVRETWADGNVEETNYQSDNIPNYLRLFVQSQGLPAGYQARLLSQGNVVRTSAQFSGLRERYEYTVSLNNQLEQCQVSRFESSNWVAWFTESYRYY
jgi:hypothetical protein